MWMKKFLRLLRKRAVLALILIVSFIYCLSSFLTEEGEPDGSVSGELFLPVSSFKWHVEKDRNSSETQVSCRNSVQGKILVADDRGYVCHRLEVGFAGCCNLELLKTKRYSCETCEPSGCCSIYEYCISCCMHPNKKALLQRIVSQASETFKMLYASVTDHFELCLAKCRTSSRSVQHENSYRDPKAKHCYAEDPPPSNRSSGKEA